MSFAGTATCILLYALSSSSTLLAQGFDRVREGLPGKSEDRVGYTMTVRLDAENKRLVGKQEIRYRNATQGKTRELRFHLYLNAFRNVRSTLMRESDAAFRRGYKSQAEFGETRFTKLQLLVKDGDPVDLLGGLRYEAPEDGNADDRTVAVVPLPVDFDPGTEILLKSEFDVDLPKAYRRTGWGPGNFFMMAQWFPKLGVLQDADAGLSSWNCHQFHASTEFFADFGSYDVRIEVPAGFKVGATGKQIEEGPAGEGYVFHHFVQKDVHDFAWVADPDYSVYVEDAYQPVLDPKVSSILEDVLGYRTQELALTPVRITYLLQPEHDRKYVLERWKKSVHIALDFFGSRFGRYPYETLTVVDPTRDEDGRGLGGGMEYPTLITCGSPRFPHPRQLSPEGVTVHEFGHQFWFALSGNNEFESAWLDEGFNSWSEGRALDLAYRSYDKKLGVGAPLVTRAYGPWIFPGPPAASLGPLPKLDKVAIRRLVGKAAAYIPWYDKLDGALGRWNGELRLLPKGMPELDVLTYLPVLGNERLMPTSALYGDRAGFLRAGIKDPVDRFAWTYADRPSYRSNSYSRTSTNLATLERFLGPKVWTPLMRRFHERARFAHPKPGDFYRTVEEMGGVEAGRLARDLFLTTKSLDYSVTVKVKPPWGEKGLFDKGEKKDTEVNGATEITVYRKGQIVVPVTVRFVYWKDGAPVNEDVVWKAAQHAPWQRWVVSLADQAKKGELIQVYVDPPRTDLEPWFGPGGVYLVDQNLLNNAWQKTPNQRPAKRRATRALLWTQCLSNFFGVMG